jgi:carbamoyl-phosphate synthase small subunit
MIRNFLQDDRPALLMLANGMLFKGQARGAEATVSGELCFNTNMTGYQEVFTDPSYTGQIMVMTNVHQGNYGTIPAESESRSLAIRALVCREFSDHFSRPYPDAVSLETYFLKYGICAIQGVDTRALVAILRESGTMNAVVSTDGKSAGELEAILQATPSMEGLELSSKVSCATPYEMGNPDASYRVAVIDYGAKQSILEQLVVRDTYVRVFPYHTTYEEVMQFSPQGILLSNGPGDPAAMPRQVEEIKKWCSSGVPVFGICLGHQMLCLAHGMQTYKLKYGHRGGNHPVKNLITGRCEITSQNHGFGVMAEDGHPELEITHINLNDGSLEGVRHRSKPIFSVQYHPEASPGPHDSRYHFDHFISLIKAKNP